MKYRSMYKTLMALFTLLCVTTTLSSQTTKTTQSKDTTIYRKVQIEKDYEPEIGTHKRNNVELQMEKPKVEQATTEYSRYAISLKPENQAVTINATKPCDTTLLHATPEKGYLQLGFGPYWTEMLDFWYPILNSKDGYFDVGIHHNGDIQPANEKHSAKHYINTALDINFNKEFDPGILYLNLGYRNEWLNYYGLSDLDSLSTTKYFNVANQDVQKNLLIPDHQSLNRLAFTIGMKSDGVLPSNWFYNVSLGYRLLTTTNRLQEHQVQGLLNTGMMVGMHKLDINFGFLGLIYSSQPWYEQTPLTEAQYATAHQNNGIITLSPAYVLQWKKLHLRLGVKSNFAFVNERKVAVSPDVIVDYTVSDIVNFFGGVTGDYQIHSLWNTLNENRYYAIEHAAYDNTYIPIDAFVGFKLRPIDGLNITADLHYKMVKDAAFYRNNAYQSLDGLWHYSNNFVTDHDNASLFTVGVKASYNYNERFRIYGGMRYGKWQLKTSSLEAWHMPTWQFELGAEARIYKGLSANIDFASQSKSKNWLPTSPTTGTVVEVGPMYDLNFGANYQFERNWSIFLKLNNLVAIGGKNYQPWYGYDTIGFNAMIGASLRF
ncbi:MAG: hypothetical protein Q4D14_07500 [Bacteroidales bacterium]|nr:hypothetical protein [Bacteroidales bacterium]